MGNVVFSQEDFDKIQTYTNLLPNSEIACMGYATLEGSDVKVNEVFLVPQVIDLMGVEFIETGLPYAVKKAAEENRLDELRFCWHSHATHGAFFSTTDEEMVRKIRDSGPIPWFCSAILNGKGDTHAQIDVFGPGLEGPIAEFTHHVAVELDFTVEGSPITAAEEQAIEEIEKFCTKKHSHKHSPKDKRKSQGSTSKPGDGTTTTLTGPSSSTDWKKPTCRDIELHAKAKKQKWDCYCDDKDIAHYWSWTGTKVHFEGSAPIPLKKDGEWAIPIDETVIDGSAVDDDKPELILLESLTTLSDEDIAAMNEEELEAEIEKRGQV